MWGQAAKRSYDPSNTPDYVKNILGPMRKYYISEDRAEMELLSSNVQVIWCKKFVFHTNDHRKDPMDTMPLRRTLQLSTFTLEILLPWVAENKLGQILIFISCRIWEKSEDDRNWFHFGSGRSFWTFSWIQPHFICGGYLLVLCRPHKKIILGKM